MGAPRVATFDMKVEVIIIPVADVDRAKEFYLRLGLALGRHPPTVVQFTPPGSAAPSNSGRASPRRAPGSGKGYLIVSDIVTARERWFRPVPMSARSSTSARTVRSAAWIPSTRSYFSRATFSDPDGNAWLLQEITTRLPGRVDPRRDVVRLRERAGECDVRRAATAHGEHEQRTGERDENWPAWYAEYMVADQAGHAAADLIVTTEPAEIGAGGRRPPACAPERLVL